jgi:hypothetical protein
LDGLFTPDEFITEVLARVGQEPDVSDDSAEYHLWGRSDSGVTLFAERFNGFATGVLRLMANGRLLWSRFERWVDGRMPIFPLDLTKVEEVSGLIREALAVPVPVLA